MNSTLVTIPARKGKADFVEKGRVVRVINTHGQQMVDTWAFNRHDLAEFMSMEHSRAHVLRLIPRVGDSMLSNRRRPILTFLEDTSGGIHDTVIAACDRYRYELLGCRQPGPVADPVALEPLTPARSSAPEGDSAASNAPSA